MLKKVSNASEKISNAFGKAVNIMFDQYMPFGQKNVMQWLDCSNMVLAAKLNLIPVAGIEYLMKRDSAFS